MFVPPQGLNLDEFNCFHTSWQIESIEGKNYEWLWTCVGLKPDERWKSYLLESFVLIKTHPHPLKMCE